MVVAMHYAFEVRVDTTGRVYAHPACYLSPDCTFRELRRSLPDLANDLFQLEHVTMGSHLEGLECCQDGLTTCAMSHGRSSGIRAPTQF